MGNWNTWQIGPAWSLGHQTNITFGLSWQGETNLLQNNARLFRYLGVIIEGENSSHIDENLIVLIMGLVLMKTVTIMQKFKKYLLQNFLYLQYSLVAFAR